MILAAFLFLALLSGQGSPAHTEFYEGFDGAFSQGWQTGPGALPREGLQPFRDETVEHVGPPGATFGRLGAATILRMETERAARWSCYGYLSEASVAGPNLDLEARINTLDQGGGHIDGLFGAHGTHSLRCAVDYIRLNRSSALPAVSRPAGRGSAPPSQPHGAGDRRAGHRHRRPAR